MNLPNKNTQKVMSATDVVKAHQNQYKSDFQEALDLAKLRKEAELADFEKSGKERYDKAWAMGGAAAKRRMVKDSD